MFSRTITSITIALLGSLLVFEGAAEAQRKNPLEGQPAVRHRLLLVKQRFEITPAFESSVNADFKHTLSAGLKLEYLLSDMFSLGTVGFFGAGVNTGLISNIINGLPVVASDRDPLPSCNQWEQHLITIP